MKKYLTILFFLIVYILSMDSTVLAADVGLLRGKLPTEANPSTKISLKMTDGNDSTGESFSPGEYAIWDLGSEKRIDRLYYKVNQTPYIQLALLDSQGNQISIAYTQTNGAIKTLSSPVMARYAKIYHLGNPGTSRTVYEVEIYESTDIPPPPVPTNLTGSNITSGSVQLNWDMNSSSDSDFAGWNVYCNGVKMNESPLLTNAYKPTGLLDNTSYTFYVTAVNRVGKESSPSNTIVTLNDTQSPLAPIGLAVIGNKETADLTWHANTEPDLAGYNVYKNTVRDNGSIITVNRYTVNGLDDNKEYVFTVTALDQSGNESGHSQPISYYYDTIPPAKPKDLKATGGNQLITLNWTPNKEKDLQGYFIYDSNKKRVNINPVTNGSSYEVKGLSLDTAYTFYLTAVDVSGNESDFSDPATARTTKVPPAPQLAAKSGNGKVELSWNDISGATSYLVFRDGSLIATVNETKYLDVQVENDMVYAYEVSAVVSQLESPRSNQVKARPGNFISFEPGGATEAIGADILDIIKTGLDFAKQYGLYIVVVLAIVFAPTILSFLVWIMRKPSKQPKQLEKPAKKAREPLSPEEKEKRARERKLNKARDDKYEFLTRQNRIAERDSWVKSSGYLRPEERQQKAREERNRKAREQRAAAKRSSGGSGRTTRKGRGSRGSRKPTRK